MKTFIPLIPAALLVISLAACSRPEAAAPMAVAPEPVVQHNAEVATQEAEEKFLSTPHDAATDTSTDDAEATITQTDEHAEAQPWDQDETAREIQRLTERYQIWEGQGSPVSITIERPFAYGVRDHLMVIRSRADELVVHGISLNRGNCQHSHPEKVMVPLSMPFTLKFGQARKVRVLCDQVIEASIDTQFGETTFAQ